jgi:hypothetical protein
LQKSSIVCFFSNGVSVLDEDVESYGASAQLLRRFWPAGEEHVQPGRPLRQPLVDKGFYFPEVKNKAKKEELSSFFQATRCSSASCGTTG